MVMDKLGVQLLIAVHDEYYRCCGSSEGSGDVHKRVGVVKDRTDVFVKCACVWFRKRIF